MTPRIRLAVLAALSLPIGLHAATASAAGIDVGANTTVGGELFADFSHIQLQNENAAGQRIDTAPDGTGFDVKRFYLIVDHRFNEVWAADLTTDAQFSTASTTPSPLGHQLQVSNARPSRWGSRQGLPQAIGDR